jgi:hypothetical protein
MTAARTSRPDRPKTLMRAERWFSELDQRRIAGGPFSWLIQVDGIHVASRDAWVQVALVDQPQSSVVLHISRYATAANALAALQAWFQTPPRERPHIVDVMQLA